MIAQAIFIENFIWLLSLYLLVELFVGMDGEWRLASLHHRRTKGWSSTLHIHQINKRVDIPGLKDSQASPTINPVNLTGKVVGKVARSQPPDERVEKKYWHLKSNKRFMSVLKKTAIPGFKRGFSLPNTAS